ncbi:SGNH/GDSL hydrolase family protein [Pseudomonas lini]|uniref:SGNH/GDSL hydrolase family protein n=1 Tax=Pseudomonas lini TaxID=163011 RepID=UPI00345E625B
MKVLVGSVLALGYSFLAAAPLSQLDAVMPCNTENIKAYRILFVGDSITLHGFDETTRKNLGWSHISGMAASSRQSDYVSILSREISDAREQSTVVCYHTAGGSGTVDQRLRALGSVINMRPNLVVIQLGEHEDIRSGIGILEKNYRRLISALRRLDSRPSIIAVGPWSLSSQDGLGHYNGWSGDIDKVMASVSSEEHVPYSSVADIAALPLAHGAGSSDGVRWHPNDYGHSLYAKRLFFLYQQAASSVRD